MREPERPRPFRSTLTLLVGRLTTIKLAYWSALTALEIALGLTGRPYAERLPWGLALGALLTVVACLWAAQAARAVDRRAGSIERSIPTVATAFITASAVATPASLPLLIVERQRSLEGCGIGTCHWEAIWYWVAALAIGTVVIPVVFAVRLRSSP